MKSFSSGTGFSRSAGSVKCGGTLTTRPGSSRAAVHHHLLAEEHPGIEPADLRDPQEALLDLGDHEGDLVHVAGEHRRWERPP